MHATPREDEIESSFDQTIHYLIFNETFGFNKLKRLALGGAARLLIKNVIETQASAGSGDDTVGALLAGENLTDVFGT